MKQLPIGHYVRPLRRADRDELIAFSRSHEPDTIFLRYGHMVAPLSAERAAQLVSVDQLREVALGVFERCAGRELLHGVGRYYAEPAAISAEFALIVRESKRRMGLGTHLLFALAHAAIEHHIHELRGFVMRENWPMQRLAERYCSGVRYIPTEGYLIYSIDPKDLRAKYSTIRAHPPEPPGAATGPTTTSAA